MFEQISDLEWLAGAVVAAIGAALIAQLRRRRALLLVLWLLAPALLLTATSSFDTAGNLFGLLLIYLLIPTLPWAVVAILSFGAIRLIALLRSE